jgi:Calx-beta domain
MNNRFLRSLVTLGAALALQTTAQANEHLMQIEQIIGSVNGDVSAQAIQLRMRSNGQNFVSGGKLVVFDATGSNPITVADLASNVPIGVTGAHVLITSASFPAQTSPPAVPDFFMTDVIPASYLAAGSLLWENDAGNTIWWRLSWGGAAYTGPNDGATFNDVDGDFGPPFASALPSCGVYGLRFTRGATAKSTTNAADYAFDLAQTESYVNNAGDAFTVSGPLPSVRIQTIDADASEVPPTDTGKLRLTRTTGCTELALTVAYEVSGTATNGMDYRRLRGVASIRAGTNFATLQVRAVNDPRPEPDETVIVTLSPNAAYTVGAPSSGTVTIHSNE